MLITLQFPLNIIAFYSYSVNFISNVLVLYLCIVRILFIRSYLIHCIPTLYERYTSLADNQKILRPF